MTEDDIHEIRNKALFSERMVIDYLLPFRDEAEDLRWRQCLLMQRGLHSSVTRSSESQRFSVS